MKTFERNGKVNFVDDYNVFVGFDYSPAVVNVMVGL